MSTIHNSVGGDYAYLRGGRAFSSGVVALPGFEIARARFARALAVDDGFEAIAAHLRQRNRPLTSLCATELRSPRPFSLQGFGDFNAGYVDVLRRWGLVRDESIPVARSNACPLHEPPPAPQFHAFSYTVPTGAAHTGLLTTSDHASDAPGPRNFVVSGFAEWLENTAYPDAIVAYRDVSAEGMARKADFVLAGLERNTVALGALWSAITGVQIYTVHEIGPVIGSAFARHGLARLGPQWHYCRPPVDGLDFEVDIRSVRRELVID